MNDVYVWVALFGIGGILITFFGLLIFFTWRYAKNKSFELLKQFIQITGHPLEILGTCNQSSKFKTFYSKHPREYCFQLKSDEGKSVQVVIAEGKKQIRIPFTSLSLEIDSQGWSNRRVVVFHEDFGLGIYDFFPKDNTVKQLV